MNNLQTWILQIQKIYQVKAMLKSKESFSDGGSWREGRKSKVKERQVKMF